MSGAAYAQALNGDGTEPLPGITSGLAPLPWGVAPSNPISDWVAQQRAQAAQQGLWNPIAGMPTPAGAADIGRQYAQALLLSTTAPGIRAFHGSPYSFERFDPAAIGTGEGVQAYGHGLYFAESEPVAQSYRDKLTNIKLTADGAPFDASNPDHDAAMLARSYPTPESAIASLRQRASNWGRVGGDQAQATAARYSNAADRIEQGNLPKIENLSGKMYEVNLAADPEHFLDWDKPLSEQSQHVQDALANTGIRVGNQNTSGSDIWQNVVSHHGLIREGAAAPAATTLQAAGIPGIRYLDQGSRAQGGGTSNYVVFNPDIINIIRRYGIAGLIGGGAAAGAATQRQGASQ